MAVLFTWKHSGVPTRLIFCLEADDKPIVDSDGDAIVDGAECEVTDTGECFVFNGTSWIQKQPYSTDNASYARISINSPHNQIHERNYFLSDLVDESMADNDTFILAFKTMSLPKKVHLLVEFSTLVGGDLQVWEGATWTTNTGTANPIVNRFRETNLNSSGLLEDKTATPAFTATDNILLNPTGLGTGSAISLHHFYAWGKKEKLQAGGQRDLEELVLKPDTQYAIVFTADGGSNKAQVILNWYELTIKE